MALSMSVMILIPFVFTLLVLLLVKAPKVGASLIGAVIMALFALFGVRFFSHAGGIGMPGVVEIAIVAPFMFVLLILLFVKAPKAAVTLVGVVVLIILAGLVFFVPVTRHRRTQQTLLCDQSAGRVVQVLPEGVRIQEVSGDGLTIVNPPTLPGSGPVLSVPSPIWSEGVEDEYVADVYPSRKRAVGALGSRLQEWIGQVVEEASQPAEVVLFQEDHQRSLLWELERAIETALPDVRCSIEAGLRNIEPHEIGVTFQFADVRTESILRGRSHRELRTVSGQVTARARHGRQETNVTQSFAEKPWVEDFASFANERPQEQYIVARSWETCTSENEARDQALRDATNQVSALVAQKWPGRPAQTVSSTDLLDGGFVLDQFVQSFDGMSGRFWREAMLVDTSAQKLGRLGSRMAAQVRVQRITWAGMILSALGVLVVIIVAYLFLNMATKGYYVWSLRIAGTVLAIAGVISILLVLR